MIYETRRSQLPRETLHNTCHLVSCPLGRMTVLKGVGHDGGSDIVQHLYSINGKQGE